MTAPPASPRRVDAPEHAGLAAHRAVRDWLDRHHGTLRAARAT